MNNIQQVMKEAREAIEFHGPWWASAVEGEPLCQDEIDEVKDMVELLGTLLSGLEEAQREIERLKNWVVNLQDGHEIERERLRVDRDYHQIRATKLSGEHTSMKEALEWYAEAKNHKNKYVTDDYRLFITEIQVDQGGRARSVLSTLSPKEEQQ